MRRVLSAKKIVYSGQSEKKHEFCDKRKHEEPAFFLENNIYAEFQLKKYNILKKSIWRTIHDFHVLKLSLIHI